MLGFRVYGLGLRVSGSRFSRRLAELVAACVLEAVFFKYIYCVLEVFFKLRAEFVADLSCRGPRTQVLLVALWVLRVIFQ